MIRTAGDPLNVIAAARGAIHAVDPNLLVADVRTMDARLDQLVAQRRLRTTLLTAYAGLALLLAAIGIYGVLADFVTQHASEIGIRLALGAQTADVMHLVLRRGMGLALVGVMLGLMTAWAVTRLMKTLLFGVGVADPMTFSVIALMLLGVALAACWIPARRAARVDPLVALRHD
jgi:ABC-type antimicrobial peptide transport system permease subunit